MDWKPFWRPEISLAVMEAGGDGKPLWRPAANCKVWRLFRDGRTNKEPVDFRQHSSDRVDAAMQRNVASDKDNESKYKTVMEAGGD